MIITIMLYSPCLYDEKLQGNEMLNKKKVFAYKKDNKKVFKEIELKS